MSPEQALGRAVDHRSDIFSFGCILYEAAAGARAFAGTSAIDTLHQIIHTDPTPLSQRAPATPGELQRIVQKCLQKDPEDRYQSMKDVAVDLRSLRRQLDSGSAAVPIPTAASRWRPARDRGTARSRARPRPRRRRRVARAPHSAAGRERGRGAAATCDRHGDRDRCRDLAGRQVPRVRRVDRRQAGAVPASTERDPPGRTGRSGRGRVLGHRLRPRRTVDLLRDQIAVAANRRALPDSDARRHAAPAARPTSTAASRFRPTDRGSRSTASISPRATARSSSRTPTDRARMPFATKHPPEFFAPGFFVAPSWSPDGKRIAAGVRNSTTRDAHLVTIDLASGGETAFPDRFADRERDRMGARTDPASCSSRCRCAAGRPATAARSTFSRTRRGRCVTSPTTSSNTGTSASARTADRWSASGSIRPSGCTKCRMPAGRSGESTGRDTTARRVWPGCPDGRRFVFGRAAAGAANALVGGGRRQRSAPADERRDRGVAGGVGRRSQPGVLRRPW